MNKITEVVIDVLDEESIVLTEDMAFEDVEGWDSVATMTIIATLEMELNIQFDAKCIAEMKKVGDIIEALAGLC